MLRTYVYGPYVDDPLLTQTGPDGPGAPRHLYLKDRRFSVTALTDAAKTQVEWSTTCRGRKIDSRPLIFPKF